LSARSTGSDRYPRIYAVVRRIPKGRVATYGQVAQLAGLPGCARQVGYALHALDVEDNVPWQRVVNAQGCVSRRREAGMDRMQRVLLEAEGLAFDERDRLDLSEKRWKPRGRPGKGSSDGRLG
jgi:methylated-DNA-protein-cysteine methyltransferase-like protein